MQQTRKRVQLTDPHGRQIHKLRVQITDTCNFRCFYCMPEKVRFTPSKQLLSAIEVVSICSHLVRLGIDELRVSGGEPTLRKDFGDIISGLSELPVAKLGVTTNGLFLKNQLAVLKRTKCRYINVSLDSLNRNTYCAITKADYFDKVLEAVLTALMMGFQVKVNVVMLRGINDHEVFDFIEFSKREKVEVRFLELMKIGPFYKDHARLFVPAQELIRKIEERESLDPLSVNCDSTSFNFRTSSGARISFIASESQPFCGFCSRLRLTATGKLRACIMSESGINLKGVPWGQYPAVLGSVMAMKPLNRIEHIEQPMYQIGG
ncbi:MAG: radical SAM protein [Candidatus Omnitrophica bacterium]|nr:radical SAM protein [Candidatus Omnitrophota bacterium]